MPTILGPIVPGSDSYPALEDTYLLGGFRVVESTAHRDAIPNSRRKEGMYVLTRDNGKVWRLASDLSSWSEVAIGGGGTPNLINAVDYGLSTSNTPEGNSNALVAAFGAASIGDTVYVPPGTYKISSATFPSISRTVHFRGQANQSVLEAYDGTGQNVGNRVYEANAAIYRGDSLLPSSTDITLTANAKFGDSQISVNYVPSTLVKGSWILIRDDLNRNAWHNDSQFDAYNEEINLIESVSGTTLTLARPLTRSYSVARNARVYRFSATPPMPVISGIKFVGCRVDTLYCVFPEFRDCTIEECDWPAFPFRHVLGGRILFCTTTTPQTKNISAIGPAFYLHHSMHCLVLGHRAWRVEGAVVRRWSVWNRIIGCEFEECNTGLGLYFGDGRFNTVSDCTFKKALLVWGGGGHFADSFNYSSNCVFVDPPARAIGAGNTAPDNLTLSYDGRAFKATEEHGLLTGDAVMLGSTVGSLTGGRRYYVAACTANSGSWANEFVLGERPARKPSTATASTSNHTINPGAGWQDGDAITIHSISPPSGLVNNRIYFLKLSSGTEFNLQIRPGQTATFDGTADTVTISNAAGSEWNNGDAVAFVGGTLPTGLLPSPTVYYLRDKTDSNVFRLATTPGGSAIDFTGNGGGTISVIVPLLGATTATITVEGGRPVVPSGTASGVTGWGVGEGNVFDDHVIVGAPANVVHLFRSGSTLIRGLRVYGHQTNSTGTVIVTLGNCTDTVIEGASVYLPNTNQDSRAVHQSTCFNTIVRNSEFNLGTINTSVFTGNTNPGFRLERVRFLGGVTRANLFNANIRASVEWLGELAFPNNTVTGTPAGVTVVDDADVPSAVPGVTGNVLVYFDNLTADRTVYLDDTLAVAGDWIRITRIGLGAFALYVKLKSNSVVMYTFPSGQGGSVEFAWVNGQWIQTG